MRCLVILELGTMVTMGIFKSSLDGCLMNYLSCNSSAVILKVGSDSGVVILCRVDLSMSISALFGFAAILCCVLLFRNTTEGTLLFYLSCHRLMSFCYR